MPNLLLVYPKNPVTFWSFDESLRIAGRACAFPPLGLLTVAGLLPPGYALRLIDQNVTPLRDEDIAWADLVLTSSMIVHWDGLEEIIARCRALGTPVLNGGPLPTQYHDRIRGEAAFYLGEAEAGMLPVVAGLLGKPGAREIIDRRGTFGRLADAPLPRWDLLAPGDYTSMALQLTRGCPERCTFCNIPTLYGKTTRLKEGSQARRELDALYRAGWRGSVMVVDDNFVGNRAAMLSTLRAGVVPWQREHGYPFQFYTQASVALADDPPLMAAMREAGFETVFCGLESPVPASLKFMGAQKNLRGDAPLLAKVETLQRHGFEVQAGFILGSDTDPADVAERTIAFIHDAAIPVAMVGILGVLRDTPDFKRFQRQGRLIDDARYAGDSGLFSRTLSFVPAIAPDELFARHRRVVATINRPRAYFERCLGLLARQPRPTTRRPRAQVWELRSLLRSLWVQGIGGAYRREYWRFLASVAARSPRRLAQALRLAVTGHHLIATTARALRRDGASA